jgi:hypothetical protein
MFEALLGSRPWLFPLPCWSSALPSSEGNLRSSALPGGGRFQRRPDG